jgi:hypothetical protein
MRNCILDGKADWKYDDEKKEIAYLSQVQAEWVMLLMAKDYGALVPNYKSHKYDI